MGYHGRRILNLGTGIRALLSDIYPARIILPFFISLIFSIYANKNILFIIPLIVFLLMNYTILLKLKPVISKVFRNPDFVNV
jgi:hypothetical protein